MISGKNSAFRASLLFICAIACAFILQGAFDASDHGKAERAVRNYRVPHAKVSLGELIEAKSPGGVWATEITQGCRGVVRARYTAGQTIYEFDYDVPAHIIHPANDTGRRALETLTARPEH